jgi:peptidoglycan hydrolase CwlO-like protein
MKLKQIKLAAVLSFAALSFQAHAECTYPKAPDTIPDGKTASAPEMLAAINTFKEYNEQVNAFGSCLDEETKKVANMQIKTMKAKKVAAAQEELESRAKLFNEQVRAFKTRG